MAIDTEVCIVGAGPAGSLVAAELVRRGIPTVLIEAGPRHDPLRRAEYARQLLAGVNPWRTPIPEMDRYLKTHPVPAEPPPSCSFVPADDLWMLHLWLGISRPA